MKQSLRLKIHFFDWKKKSIEINWDQLISEFWIFFWYFDFFKNFENFKKTIKTNQMGRNFWKNWDQLRSILIIWLYQLRSIEVNWDQLRQIEINWGQRGHHCKKNNKSIVTSSFQFVYGFLGFFSFLAKMRFQFFDFRVLPIDYFLYVCVMFLLQDQFFFVKFGLNFPEFQFNLQTERQEKCSRQGIESCGPLHANLFRCLFV